MNNLQAVVGQEQAETIGRTARRLAMAVIFMTAMLNYADRWLFSVVLEPIKQEFGASDTVMGLLTGPAFAILYATLGLPLARLADRWNRRTIVVVALATWSAMTALCGMAANFVQLFLARVGVGVGEAGATPPSQSLIADYYDETERTGALAIFGLGPVAGGLLAGMVGGYLAEANGWRTALIVFGLSGIGVAFIARFLLVEPRGKPAFPPLSELANQFAGTAMGIWKRRAFVHVVAGSTLASFLMYGVFVWAIAFVLRTYEGVSLASVSQQISIIQAITGALAVLVSGYVGNRLVRRDIRYLSRFCGLSVLISFPFYVLHYLAPTFEFFLAMLPLALFFFAMTTSPALTLTHAVLADNERALGIAIVLFIANILGMGLGPLATGMASDLLAGYFGDRSLQAALVVFLLVLPWSAWHFWRSGKYVLADSAEASGKVSDKDERSEE